jgi:cytochrome P450
LFRLSLNPDVEKSLRQECRANPLPSTAAHGNEPLTAEELSSLDHLPILDAVVRETLRLHAPVVNTMRGAVKDDVIPLSRPFTDKNGVMQDSIR